MTNKELSAEFRLYRAKLLASVAVTADHTVRTEHDRDASRDYITVKLLTGRTFPIVCAAPARMSEWGAVLASILVLNAKHREVVRGMVAEAPTVLAVFDVKRDVGWFEWLHEPVTVMRPFDDAGVRSMLAEASQ